MTNTLRNFYGRSLSVAFIISVMIHLTMICAYYVAALYSKDEDIILVLPTGRRVVLPPPPSIIPLDYGGSINPVIAKPSLGVPVPVPDAQVSPDQSFPTQQEMNPPGNSILDKLGKNDELTIEAPGTNKEPEEDKVFEWVEKPPVPVIQVRPDYPEIARRTGVEGTVWVKILVGKDGKARKAIVQKSDSEILNEAAVNAALQWVFTPAMMNSGPVAVWASVPFKFKLNRE
jgi:TonB family protein